MNFTTIKIYRNLDGNQLMPILVFMANNTNVDTYRHIIVEDRSQIINRFSSHRHDRNIIKYLK